MITPRPAYLRNAVDLDGSVFVQREVDGVVVSFLLRLVYHLPDVVHRDVVLSQVVKEVATASAKGNEVGAVVEVEALKHVRQSFYNHAVRHVFPKCVLQLAAGIGASSAVVVVTVRIHTSKSKGQKQQKRN